MDDWPEKIGIPKLKALKRELGWIYDCLTDSETKQRLARVNLRIALEEVTEALKVLEIPLPNKESI